MSAAITSSTARLLERLRVRADTLRADYSPVLRRHVWEHPAVQAVLFCSLIVTLHGLTRPLLAAPTPGASFHAPVVFWELISKEIEALRQTMSAQRPGVPAYLFPLVPSVLLLVSRKKIRWEHWEAGKELRVLMMVIIGMMAWAGATFDYNMYLDRGHALDRLLLVALALLSWKRPLAVPFFAVQAVVMMREANPPLGHDDFDWRPVTELLMLFSCFAWLSFLRRVRTQHFLLLACCLWGSYYYQAGISKLFYGETGSWLTENRLSNLFVSSYHHSWLGFLPEHTFTAVARFSRHLDVPNALFTLAIAELGAIVFLFLHPRLARWWFLAGALLHVGIFAFSGIFFWKWIVVDVAFFAFLRRGEGARVHAQIFQSKLVPLFGAALIFFSGGKTFLNPQIGVAWWDTNLSERYHLIAVAESGKTWPIHPHTFAPYDARTMQENWCFVSKEPRLTSIYGITGSFAIYTALSDAKNAEDVSRVLLKRGFGCYNEEQARNFDDFVATFLSNTNHARGKKHRWLSLLGRPDHIWAQRQTDDYAFQEPVTRVEVWRERTLWDGASIHHLGRKKIHEIRVP